MSYDKAITRTDLTNILNEVLPNASVDYVVEEGTDDGWTYRKWASGYIDAFKIHNFGSQTGSVWVSPVRYKDLTYTFPDGMFASTPFVTGTAITNQWWVVQVAATSKTGGPIRVATVASTAQNVDVSISAHGSWK